MADLRHYECFVEVALRGGFTAAAKSLHLSQSAVSGQIAGLEGELGCRLFSRGRDGARLTTEGDLLLPRAQELLRLAADIESLSGVITPSGGPVLRVGATLGPLFHALPAILAKLSREHDGLEIRIRDLQASETIFKLGLGQIDLGLVSLPGPVAPDLLAPGTTSVVLAEEGWVVLVPPQHPLIELGTVPVSALKEHRLILFPEGYALRAVIDDFFSHAAFRPEPTIETGWSDLLMRSVEHGLGISIVPAGLVSTGEWDLEILPLSGPDLPPRRVISAAFRESSPVRPVIESLVSQLADSMSLTGFGVNE